MDQALSLSKTPRPNDTFFTAYPDQTSLELINHGLSANSTFQPGFSAKRTSQGTYIGRSFTPLAEMHVRHTRIYKKISFIVKVYQRSFKKLILIFDLIVLD